MVLKEADVEEQYLANKELRRDDVQKLKDWLEHQAHLPSINDLQIILFLHSCYYSNEATKKCIDNYYTAKKHCPEFFANRDPFSAEMERIFKTVACSPMPRLTPEGHLIFYARLTDVNPEMYNFNSAIKLFDMATLVYYREKGTINGHEIILDLEGCTISHMFKLNMTSMKKFMYYLQEALPVRVKKVHYVNAVHFVDKIVGLMRPFVKKELGDLLEIHTAPNDTIFNRIPKECLPNEIGGTGGSALEIHESLVQKFKDNADFLLAEEKLVADEARRPGKPRDSGDLFGIEGTFKKLDID